MTGRRRAMVSIAVVVVLAGTPAQAGVCGWMLAAMGVRISDKPPPHDPVGSLSVGWRRRDGTERHVSLNGFQGLLTLAVLSFAGTLGYNELNPDNPAMVNTTYQMPDGSSYNVNQEERKLLAAIRSAEEGGSVEATLPGVLESLQGRDDFPPTLDLAPGVTATKTKQPGRAVYVVEGLPALRTLEIVRDDAKGVVLRFESPNRADSRQPLRVSYYLKDGGLRHELSTGWRSFFSR